MRASVTDGDSRTAAPAEEIDFLSDCAHEPRGKSSASPRLER